MKELEWIIDHIDEELEGAERYAEKALAAKVDCPEWANAYIQMSQQELAHADVLHAQAVQMIQRHQGDAPEGMAWVWEREHKKYFDKAARIKAKHEMFKK